MAIGPLSVIDTFSRSHSSTWGFTDNIAFSSNRHNWLGDTEDYWDVDQTTGVAQIDAFSNFPNYDTAYIDLDAEGIPHTNDQEILMLVRSFKPSAASEDVATDYGPVMLRMDDNNFVMASIRQGSGRIGFKQCVNGAFTNLGDRPFVVKPNEWYWVRMKKATNSYSLKMWPRNFPEPTSWSVTASALLGPFVAGQPVSGDIGIGARRTSENYTVEIDTFYFKNFVEETGSAVTDGFNRIVTDGWGKLDSGHIWEGHVAHTPEQYLNHREKNVSNVSTTVGVLKTGYIGDTIAWVNQQRSGNMSAYVEFESNAGVASPKFFIGMHGTVQYTNGVPQYTGYAAQLGFGVTNFTIMKSTAFDAGWTTITPASVTPFAALATNTVYKARFVLQGNVLMARLWTGASEPSTWNITTVADSTFTSGVPFLMINQTDATVRTWQIHDYAYDTFVPTGTLYTITGSITATPTSTTIPFEVSYGNDTNLNNSISVQYRRLGDTIWTTFSGTLTRGTQKWTGTITGLPSGESFEVRATYTDTDSVVGTNPVKGTFTTTDTAIVRGSIEISNITNTSAVLTQYYEDDSNNNSTATLEYRTSSQEQVVFQDYFTDDSGTLVTDHYPDIGGGAWIEHTIDNIGSETAAAKIYRNSVYLESPATVNNIVRSYRGVPIAGFTSNDYSVEATVHAPAMSGRVRLLGRMSLAAITYYAMSYNAEVQTLFLYRRVNGTTLDTQSIPFAIAAGDSADFKLSMYGSQIDAFVNGTRVMTMNDSSITSGGFGFNINNVSDAVNGGSYTNRLTFDRFAVTYRTVGGSWTSGGAMTADRVNKKFTRTQTGLTSGSTYEFRANIADSDGVQGQQQSVIGVMKGNAVSLQSVAVTPSESTAFVTVFYADDANQNSTVTMQYKSVMDKHWKTLPQSLIRVNRTSKQFYATLAALKSGLSYEVVVRVTDPDGITEGTPSRIDTEFSTSHYHEQHDHDALQRRKHHLFKVYDYDGKYITTWEDAPEPEFSAYENGGVSDLRVKLPRKMSEIMNPSSGIGFQNRVDVWALDPSSDGFGVNLVDNPTFIPEVGGWEALPDDQPYVTLGNDYGPGDGTGVKIESATNVQRTVRSNYINLYAENDITEEYRKRGYMTAIPLVIMCMGRAKNTKLILDVEAYDEKENLIGGSEQIGETVGNEWQVLRIEFTPPPRAQSLRITLRNAGAGTVYAGNVSVRAKELMIYRGFIETFSPSVDETQESIEVEILGLASFLSDDYIDFLQYIEASAQPQNDLEEGRPHKEPEDPAQMLRDLIKMAQDQNPRFPLYATPTSIQSTGQPMRYTFRNKQLRSCFDQVRSLCPAGWNYYIDVDGCVYLRDGALAPTHKLRIGVEVLKFSADRSIRNLKNYVVVKGRQDSDRSERETYGSILEVAFDAESIKKYGKRVLHITDSQLTHPADAQLIAEGRLEEHNHEEQKVTCVVIDEKAVQGQHTLRGYNIESFRPGDNVVFFDPIAGPNKTYWNQFEWDEGNWDYTNEFTPLTDSVPIKRVQYSGDYVTLELSERQPSSIGDFGRMYRVLQLRSNESGE